MIDYVYACFMIFFLINSNPKSKSGTSQNSHEEKVCDLAPCKTNCNTTTSHVCHTPCKTGYRRVN